MMAALTGLALALGLLAFVVMTTITRERQAASEWEHKGRVDRIEGRPRWTWSEKWMQRPYDKGYDATRV